MVASKLENYIKSLDFNVHVKELYCTSDEKIINKQRKRYLHVLKRAVELYGDGDYHFISSPGRTEICGNHTDHQRGNVVAASINLDNLCVVKKSDDNIVNFCDDIFKMNEVNLNDLKIHDNEKGNTKSIIRGTAARLKKLGYKIGGFKAFQDMNVLVGSGLSSSACFEILITEIYNYFYNKDKIKDIERAQISQWVENNYFGKPCGLMDQMAISVGSFVGIDFKNKNKPKVKKQKFNFNEYGYELLIVNTKGSHADLTAEYATIPGEMKLVAKAFGKDVLSEVNEKVFFANIRKLREKIKNDRAILRASHYFYENERAKEYLKALAKKDIDNVIKLMKESGNSSYQYLQNVYPSSCTTNEGVAIGIAMSKKIIYKDGTCRVQGGGFAGTLQAIVKKKKVSEYIKGMSKIFGDDAIMQVRIRNVGTKVVI